MAQCSWPTIAVCPFVQLPLHSIGNSFWVFGMRNDVYFHCFNSPKRLGLDMTKNTHKNEQNKSYNKGKQNTWVKWRKDDIGIPENKSSNQTKLKQTCGLGAQDLAGSPPVAKARIVSWCLSQAHYLIITHWLLMLNKRNSPCRSLRRGTSICFGT